MSVSHLSFAVGAVLAAAILAACPAQARPPHTPMPPHPAPAPPPPAAVPAEAVQAACAFAKTLATYDYTNFSDYQQRVTAGSTGAFRTQFVSNSGTVAGTLMTHQIQAEATHADCQPISGDANHALVTAHVDQAFSGDTTNWQDSSAHYTQVLSLEYLHGRWLTDKVTTTQA